MSHEPTFPRLEVPPSGDLQSSLPASAVQRSLRSVPSGSVSPSGARASSASVWLLPALKLAGFCCVLTCIAWLGEHSRITTIYGPELPPTVAPEPAQPRSSASAPAPAPDQPLVGVAAPTSPPPAGGLPPCAPVATANAPAATPSAILPDGRLILNEATAQDLDRLPGIGKKRADDIVALRTRLGRFKRLQDLLRIRGIGPRSLASLGEHLVVDRPMVPGEAVPSEGPRAPGTAAPRASRLASSGGQAAAPTE